jgi:tRNA(adenine34) deaminase
MEEKWIKMAIDLAKKAETAGEVPIGALLIKDDYVIAEAYNQPISLNDPTAHAEVIALRLAAKALENYRLVDTTLYVTLEPCAMCVGALIQARVSRLVFGAFDKRAGAVASVFRLLDESSLNHRIDWKGGVLASECAQVLQQFFQKRRI